MASGLICDACDSHVKYDSRRGEESETGEESAWITLRADNVRPFHACTRECAKVILDSPEFGGAVDAAFAVIASVARAIRDEQDLDHDAA